MCHVVKAGVRETVPEYLKGVVKNRARRNVKLDCSALLACSTRA